MPKITANFFGDNIFTFVSNECFCAKDIIHTSPNQPPTIKFKVSENKNKPLLFAYKAKTGLVRVASNGTIEEDNILGTLLSLSTTNPKKMISFFERNGFLFPVSSDYLSIESELVDRIIENIRNTVELMTAIAEIKKDYTKIVLLTLRLMFNEMFKIELETMEKPYYSCNHSFMNTLKITGISLTEDQEQESFENGCFSVNDTINGSTYKFDRNEYNDIISGSSTSDNRIITPLYKQIVSLYCSYNGSSIERKMIEFIFHLIHDANWRLNYNSITGISAEEIIDLTSLSSEMKTTALEIARHILGEEINANLNGIFPQYDVQAMSPSWKVDSLLSALYFSLFYIKPDLELYRQCANPRCQKYFLVKTTSTHKKYCSTECCNRVTQDRYRKNRREKS